MAVAELGRVTDKDELGSSARDLAKQNVEVVGPRHRGLVEHDHVPVCESSLSVLHVEKETGEGIRADAGLLAKDRGGHRRRRDPDELEAGAFPSLTGRIEGP